MTVNLPSEDGAESQATGAEELAVSAGRCSRDPRKGRRALAGAGHLPPALLVGDGPTQLIRAPIGPPLGTGVGGYEQIFVDQLPDQILLMHLDGPVERWG